MAYKPFTVAVTTTSVLLWETSTGVSPDSAIAPSSRIFQAHGPNDPLPMMMVIPSGGTLYLVGSAGVLSGGIALPAGPVTIQLNIVGNDAMYGYGSGSFTLGLIVGRQ